MRLTEDEEKMLSGGYGEGYRRAIEILVKMGDFYGAECLVPISIAFIVMGTDSVDKDLFLFLNEFADQGATFKSPLTITFPGTPERDTLNQKLGAQFTYSTGGTPIDLFPLPIRGQYVIPGGTNSTTLFNSIIGAYANSEGPVGQYMGAIVGKTPKYGYLLPENRLGKTLFEIKAEPKNATDWNALGFYISKTISDHWWDVPVLTGIRPEAISYDDLISLCASIASYGAANHFLIEGISPEAYSLEEAFGGKKPHERYIVGPAEIKEVYDLFHSSGRKPDLVEIHTGGGAGLQTVYKIARMVEGKKVNPEIPLCLTMNAATKSVADRYGLTRILEMAGVEIGGITWKGKKVHPWTESKKLGIGVIVTDSAKNCSYMGQQEAEMVLLPTEECVKVALTGKLEV
jgi:predicted aconitase